MRKLKLNKLNRVSILVYGEPGIGKTSLLRTIPKNERACVLSAESGLLSIRDLVLNKTVEGFEIESFQEMYEAFDLLSEEKKAKAKFKWIFIDSLSEISQKCYDSYKELHPKKKDSFKLWEEYQASLLKLIKNFRDIEHYNIVFTCLASTARDDDGYRFIHPEINGNSLKQKLAAYFDEVFYMTIHEDEEKGKRRIFITEPAESEDGRVTAKDRSGALKPIEKPDLSAIIGKILNKGV
jgi:hypothetical protein